MAEFKVILKSGKTFIVQGERVVNGTEESGLLTSIEKENFACVFQVPTREILVLAELASVTEVLSESDISDYLVQLESYEESLAKGEIQW
jgi:hypothetical protein